MAKLSEIYKVGMSVNDIPKTSNTTKEVNGGRVSAPASFAGGRKLSDVYTVGMEIPKAQSIPAVSTPSTPSIDYNAIINEYESLPKTDLWSRMTSKDSREAYKRKQELNPLYEQAKDNRAKDALTKYGVPDDFLSRIAYDPLTQKTNLIDKAGATLELKKMGVPQSLIQDIFDYAGRQNSAKKNERLTKFADEHEALGTLASGVLKAQSDIPGLVGNVIDWAQGDPLSASSGQNANTKTVQSMRNAVSDDKKGVSKFAYDVGTSLMDMIPIIATGGAAGLGWAGASAAQGSIPELIDRGLTPNQIMASSVANGIAEAALERLPLGNLEKWAKQPIEKSIKSIAKIIGSQMATEAIEEMGTDVINLITDNLITGDKSQFKQDEKQYGFKTALWNFVKQTVYDGLAGAASGGLLGGMNTARNTVVNGFADSEVPKVETQNAQSKIPELQQENVKQVDNSFNLNYNQGTNVEKGAPYVGSEREAGIGNDGRGSGSVPSELPSGEQSGINGLYSVGAEGINPSTGSSSDTKQLGYNNRVFTEDTDVDPSVSSFDFRYSNNNVNDWRDNFEKAKASNDHGGAVDSHSAEELQKIVDEGGNLYMSGDKTVFGIVTPDGNLSGVCKADGSPHKMAATNVAKTGVKLGARKGDCFGRALVNMYAPAGFKPVGRCTYGYGFNDVMDKQVREQLKNGEISKEPDVYALVYDENVDKAKKYTQAELDALPLYEGDNAYDDMLAARDKLLNPGEEVTEKAAEPQKEYSTKKVEDKKLNKVINDLFNMFGKTETGKEIKAQLIASINEYEDTLSPEVYNRIYNLCEQGEKVMQGKEYVKVDDRGKRASSTKSHVYPWFHSTITDEVMSYIDRVTEMDNLLNKSNEAYRENINNIAETLSTANADRTAWAYLNEIKEAFDEYVNTGDEDFLESAIDAAEAVAKNAGIKYENIQKDFEQGLQNAVKENQRQNENKVMAEDVGLKKSKAKKIPALAQTESIEEPIENYAPESKRELSQFATNTMAKARMLDNKKKRALFERMKKEGAFDKQTQSDIEVGLKAMDNIDANGLEAEKQKIEEQGTETTAVQLLEAEMIGADEIKKAIKNKDTADAIRFFSRLTNRISEVGRALRITQLYQDEATKIVVQSNLLGNSSAKEIENKGKKKPKSKEGKILDTVDKITNGISDNIKKDKAAPKKPKTKKPPLNRKLANALNQLEFGKQEKTPKPKKTHEQIKQEVINTLKEKVPYRKISSFSDAQIEAITNYVETGKVDVDLLAQEMKNLLATNSFFTIDESTPMPQQKGNTKLQAAIDLLTNGRTEKTVKEKNPAQVRREVEATFGADIDSFSEAGIDFLVNMLMDPTISKEVIADELEQYGKTGEFYTIDESTKVNKPKSAKLAKALNYAVENKMQNKTEKAPKSFNTILEEVNNTLDDEGASVNFSDAAREFLAVMMQEGVSTEVMADEINHYLEHGEFYTLDEGTEVSKPTYQRLQNLLNEMGNDTPVQEKAPLTYEEIRERVKNTLEKEYASTDFTDSEISYLARMFADGASTDEIRQALIKKVSSGSFGISAEDMEKIVDLCEQAEKAPTSKESAKFKEQAYAIAAKYAPKASFMDKWNSWRMMSMLLSIPTHTRNIGGNLNWGGVTEIKDNIAALMEEAFIKEGQPRTKAVLSSKDSALVKACEEDFDNTVYEEMAGTSKWNQKTAIERQRRIFKPEWMEKARKFSGNTLEAEDMWALKRKYKKALARYLKANGYNANVFKTDNAILDEARAYAIEQAKDATFHADNALSDMLNDWSRSAREHGSVVGELAIEANFPFKKTPVNVAVQGLRYTPGIGLIPKIAGTNVFQDIFSSQKNVNAFIDVLSRQLTGAVIFGLGAALAAKGWLVTKKDEDEDDPYGKGSNYAIKFGNKSFTIDWAAPAALPLFVGAEVYHALSPNDDPKEDKGFFEALASVGEPIIETSMLQGLDNTLNSLANAGNYKLPTLAANIATGYASQGIPTVLGQIARTVDPYRRSTRTNASSSKNPATAAIQKTAEKTINKIPFLSMTNQKYTDIWGNPQKNSHAIFGDNIAGRAVQNFLLPGYVNDVSMTKSEEKLAKLQKTYEGKGSLIPSLANANKPDGSRMSNSEYEKFTKVRGTEMQKAVEAALKYDGKSGIKTEDLQDCIHDIENFANYIAEYKQFGRKMSDTYKKAYEAYQLGGYDAVMQYYLMNKNADADGNGSITQDELATYLRNSGIPASQREQYFKIKFPKAKEIPRLR